MSSCPHPDQLQQLLNGDLGGQVELEISAHVETCLLCQGLLEGLTAVLASPTDPTEGQASSPPMSPKELTGRLEACPMECSATAVCETRSGRGASSTETPSFSGNESSVAPRPSSAPQNDRVNAITPSESGPRPSSGASRTKLSDDQLHRLRHLLPPGSSADAAEQSAPSAAAEPEWPNIPGYQILRLLGRGGAAVVYEARQLRLNRRVALKILRAGELATPEQLVRFCAEAEIVAGLQHPNIVQIYEVGTHGKQPYFALELMEGGALPDALGGKPLAAHAAAKLVETLARAMHYAHSQGIVHRDLNPSNILLTSRADRGAKIDAVDPLSSVPKISDFGLAKHLDQDSRLTKTGFVMGTPGYMAPEQVRGQNDRVGPLADVYALGAILYELLTGRPPFQAPTSLEVMNQVIELDPVPPSRLIPKLPRDLEVICLKCLEKEPDRRYISAAALADELRRYLNGEPIHARRVAGLERTWRWAKRRPAPATLLLLVLLVAVVGFPAVTLLWLEAATARQRAVDQEQEAVRARNESRQQSADLLFARGLEFAQQGEVSKGLHWMLEGLRTAPADAADFQRAVRINLAAWSQQICSLRYLLAHSDSLEAVALSPDGETFVTGGIRNEIYRWDTATGQALGEPIRTPGQILSVAYSPDGKVLLAGGGSHHSDRGDVNCWVRRCDAATGEPIGPPLAYEFRVWAVAYSPDAKRFLVGTGSADGSKGQAQLYDAATGQPIGPPQSLPFAVAAVAFSPDGKQFVTATGSATGIASGDVQLWETASGEPVGPPLREPDGIRAVCFSPDGRLLLTAGGAALRRWDAATGKPIGQPIWHPTGITALGITPDGATIITGDGHGLVRLWDAATDQLLDARAHHDGWVCSLGVSPDGRLLLTGGQMDRSARLWDLARSCSRPVVRGMDGQGKNFLPSQAQSDASSGLRFQSIAYSPDRRTVLTGGAGGLAQLWEAATDQPIGMPMRHPYAQVRAVAFSPDGKKVATSCIDQPEPTKGTVASSVRIWDAATGQPLTPWVPQRNWVVTLAFSPDGNLLATGDYSSGVHLWDTATGERVGKPLVQRDIVLSLAFNPDGKTLAAGTAHDWNRDPQARMWDVAAGTPLGEPLRHQNYVLFVAFTPDGKTVVTGSLDSTFRLWDAVTGEPRSDYRTVMKGWRCAALSPAGDRLATAGGDGTARLWSLTDGSPLLGATLPHPRESSAVSVAFSPDGTLLVVGHADGSAQLWDLATDKPLGPPVVQRGTLLGVAFAPDGRSFLTTAADGDTRVWPVPAPLPNPNLQQLALWLQVRTGLRMDEGQTVARLTPEEWRQRHQKLSDNENAFSMWINPPLGDHFWHDACARDAEQAGQLFTAQWHLERLVKVRPDDWLHWARRGRAYRDAGDVDKADEAYRQAQTLGGGDGLLDSYRQRAATWAALAKWPEAIWYLDRLQAAGGDDWQLYADQAEVHGQLGHAAAREAALEKALARGPDREFLARLADERARQGQWPQAAALLCQATAEPPLDTTICHMYGLACLKTGDLANYQRLCDRLLRELPARHDSFALASAVMLGALRPDAVADWQQPLAMMDDLLTRLTETEAKTGGEPLRQTRHAWLSTKGAALFRAGRFAEAVACFEDGLAAHGEGGNIQDWAFLAMVRYRLGQADEARRWLAKAAGARLQRGEAFWETVEQDLLTHEAETLLQEPPPRPGD